MPDPSAPGRRRRPRPCGRTRRASFLASATPAAGKTTFGLHIAHRMLSAGFVSRVVVAGPTTHICRQWAADAAPLRHRPRAEPAELRRAGVGRLPRRRRHLPDDRRRAGDAPAAPPRRRPTLLIADEPHHMGDLAAWGLQTRTRLRRRPLPAAALGHALPLRQLGDPLGHLRRGRPQPRRLRLRLPAGAARPGLPPDHLPALRRRDGVGLRRPAAQRRLRPRPAGGGVGPAPADGAQPGGRVDGRGAARRRRQAERGARRRAPRRGRPGHRLRPGARAGDRGAARVDLGRAARAGDERRARRQPADRRVRRLRPTLAGLGPDGLRGRRHPPPAGRRLRDGGPDRALLPPGGRPLHPHHPAAAPPDELPADAGRPAAEGARPRDRAGAPPRPRPLAGRRGGGARSSTTPLRSRASRAAASPSSARATPSWTRRS